MPMSVLQYPEGAKLPLNGTPPVMPDPRTIEGELMCPALYPARRVADLKRELLRDYEAQSAESNQRDRRAFSPSMVAGA